MQTGVIGVGAMGAGIATRLIERAYKVHVRDIDSAREQRMKQAGATVAINPAAMIASVDVRQKTRSVLRHRLRQQTHMLSTRQSLVVLRALTTVR